MPTNFRLLAVVLLALAASSFVSAVTPCKSMADCPSMPFPRTVAFFLKCSPHRTQWSSNAATAFASSGAALPGSPSARARALTRPSAVCQALASSARPLAPRAILT
ncbi:hypothetical protein BC828DRAFT_392207 [Blastocladiella britannica]|nr:hypothetical protein BC828DRAFT_392207 [Blastocladiella britannica]